jgi:flagellar biosynthesis anti-sigma factor FlgM
VTKINHTAPKDVQTKKTSLTADLQTTKIDGARAATKPTPDSSYRVDLSPKSQVIGDSYKKALEIARNTPEVREDRVAQLKKKIAEGKYNVDSEKIAEGIVTEAIKDHLAEQPYDSAT